MWYLNYLNIYNKVIAYDQTQNNKKTNYVKQDNNLKKINNLILNGTIIITIILMGEVMAKREKKEIGNKKKDKIKFMH